MSAPILVTGAPGTVGTPLVMRLLAAGASVRVAARHPAGASALAAAGAEVVPFGFTDPSTSGTFDRVRRMFLLRPPAIADVDGVIGPAIDAARAAGVEHSVFLPRTEASSAWSPDAARSRAIR